jgi:hypothetical protein
MFHEQRSMQGNEVSLLANKSYARSDRSAANAFFDLRFHFEVVITRRVRSTLTYSSIRD